jgi:hypothetical protein
LARLEKVDGFNPSLGHGNQVINLWVIVRWCERAAEQSASLLDGLERRDDRGIKRKVAK